jgi:hypothetical protein
MISALDRGEWSADLPPGKEPPSTHWIGGWVSPRASLDAAKIKISCTCRKSNPVRPARSYRGALPTELTPYKIVCDTS